MSRTNRSSTARSTNPLSFQKERIQLAKAIKAACRMYTMADPSAEAASWSL